MKLIYENKEINLTECKSFFTRLKGFMFKKILITPYFLINVIVFILFL